MTTISPVSIVGAGPGDPDLLTVKALRLLRQCEVVVYDRLVSAAILDLVPAGASRIFAGKAARDHHMPQDEINALLVRLARSGRRVVRLKGGDPFVFGRGGEEAVHLAENKIPFQIVPGITSSAGCAAYAGIPLTHRGLSKSVRFIAGHREEGKDLDLDWPGLAHEQTTLVIYMGRTNVRTIADELMNAGLAPATPAGVIYSGTLPEQRTVVTTLEGLADAVEATGLVAPTLLVIGKVVALAEVLAWYRPGAEADSEAHG